MIRRTLNLLFVAVVLCSIGVYLFRAELAEAVSDALVSNSAAIKRTWQPGMRGKFSLRPERNDAAFIRVSSLASAAPSSIGVPVSFELSNLGAANDFPNIAVVMVDASRRPVRRLVCSPADYTHGKRFESERIELLLQPRSGERGFTVQAFYGAHL